MISCPLPWRTASGPLHFNSSVCCPTAHSRAFNLQILAFPLCWFHPKFDRGAFLFSLGFVLTPSASIQPYKLVISKFASILESLEFQETLVSQSRRTAFFKELLTAVGYTGCQIRQAL